MIVRAFRIIYQDACHFSNLKDYQYILNNRIPLISALFNVYNLFLKNNIKYFNKRWYVRSHFVRFIIVN